MIKGPGGVDHDEVAAGAGHAVEQGKKAVVDHLEGTQEQTVRDVVWVVEPETLTRLESTSFGYESNDKLNHYFFFFTL